MKMYKGHKMIGLIVNLVLVAIDHCQEADVEPVLI